MEETLMKKNKCYYLLLIVLLIAVSSVSFAQNDSESLREMGYFNEELWPKKLSKHGDGNMPVVDYIKIWQGAISTSWFLFKLENALYKLKFYPDLPMGKANAELTKAIAKFQKSIGAKPTGDLLVWQWVELIKRVNQLYPLGHYPGRIIPNPLKMTFADRYVEGSGTWQLEHATKKFPFLQTSNIRCFKISNVCVEADAMIVPEPDNEQLIEEDYLTVGSIIWTIDNWKKNEIIATNNAAACLKAKLYIDMAKKRIYKFYRFSTGKGCNEHADKDPYIFKLVDGVTYASGFYQSKEKEANKFVNPEYTNRMLDLQKKSH